MSAAHSLLSSRIRARRADGGDADAGRPVAPRHADLIRKKDRGPRRRRRRGGRLRRHRRRPAALGALIHRHEVAPESANVHLPRAAAMRGGEMGREEGDRVVSLDSRWFVACTSREASASEPPERQAADTRGRLRYRTPRLMRGGAVSASPIISRHCDTQPVARPTAKSTVNMLTGIPRACCAVARTWGGNSECESTMQLISTPFPPPTAAASSALFAP